MPLMAMPATDTVFAVPISLVSKFAVALVNVTLSPATRSLDVPVTLANVVPSKVLLLAVKLAVKFFVVMLACVLAVLLCNA